MAFFLISSIVLGLLNLLKVVSDRIARSFNRSNATRAVALDISKAFDRVWHAGLLQKPKSYGLTGQIYGLISSFLIIGRLRLEGSILGPTLFLLHINGLPEDVICNIAIYADDTTLCSNYDHSSDLW